MILSSRESVKMRSDLMKNRVLYRRLETNRYLCTIIQNKMGINKLKVVLIELPHMA